MLKTLNVTLSKIDIIRLLNYKNNCCSFYIFDKDFIISIVKSKKLKKKYVVLKINAS
jgi:hypothetical protein